MRGSTKQSTRQRSPLAWRLLLLVAIAMAIVWPGRASCEEKTSVRAGFAEADITPKIEEGRPVWLAGYGQGRQATGVHDPLMVRCVVLNANDAKIAILSVDCIGLQLPEVERIRESLKDFQYVIVSSTHVHEGPDVIGIWGRNPAVRGVDDEYVKLLIEQSVACVREAEKGLAEVKAEFGTAEDENLVNDSRLPHVKDGVLRTLRLKRTSDNSLAGILVQWNSHPEAMGSRNTLVTADFPASTVTAMKQRYACPIVYVTGTVGGLMGPVRDRIRNAAGELLHEGDFEYARLYGEEVADLANQALERAEPIELTPFESRAVRIALPVTNPFYRSARALGVLTRKGFVWTGDPRRLGEPLLLGNATKPMAVETEVAYVRLGELHIASIPGEIYPELVYGKFQEPVETNVDFKDAELEPSVASLMPGPKWMIFGLSNDEIGYIIPRRQWDLEPPYAYGRNSPQYGEVNSCGADVAPIIMKALQDVVEKK